MLDRYHPPAAPPLAAFRSVDANIRWPAMLDADAAAQSALQWQLERTQWWSPAELLRHQLVQLDRLMQHTYQTVPAQKGRLDAAGYRPDVALTAATWERVPVLTRHGLQQAGATLRSVRIPERHGKTFESSSSGSTGSPRWRPRMDPNR